MAQKHSAMYLLAMPLEGVKIKKHYSDASFFYFTLIVLR